jgi:hypothetical protein
MSKRKREPRPAVLSTLPTFARAEEAEISAALQRWYGHLTTKLDSEAGHNAIRDNLLWQLERGATASLPLACIIEMADRGHPPADHALRIFVHSAIDRDRFADLPVQVRAYSQRALTRPPLPIGYPSNQPQVVSDFARDIAIWWFYDQTLARWPQVPPLHSTTARHSACWLVGLLFSLSEQQVRRIIRRRTALSRRTAEFLLADLSEQSFGEGPNDC